MAIRIARKEKDKMRLRNGQPLNMDQIRYAAPSVFATQPHASASTKYRFIPTLEVVEQLLANGWNCMEAGEQRVRSESKAGFQKHILKFANKSLGNVGDSRIEMLMTNSHDLTTAYSFRAGVFRLVCSNGMTVSDGTFQRISVKHVGFKAENIIEASYRLIDAVPKITQSIDTMRSIELNKDEKIAFANAALIAKYGAPTEENPLPVEPQRLLWAKRHEDNKNDLWSTFNTVQEHLIRGGVRDKNFRRTRAVTSINEDTKLNAALWTLSESMAKMKSA